MKNKSLMLKEKEKILATKIGKVKPSFLKPVLNFVTPIK